MAKKKTAVKKAPAKKAPGPKTILVKVSKKKKNLTEDDLLAAAAEAEPVHRSDTKQKTVPGQQSADVPHRTDYGPITQPAAAEQPAAPAAPAADQHRQG